MLATFLTFVFILFYTSGFDSGHDAELQNPHGFIQKTKDAMHGGSRAGEAVLDSQTGQKAGHIPADKDADGDVDDDDRQMAAQMQERLKAAEVQAKEKANQKGGLRPDAPGQVVGVGSSADGQKDGQTEKTDKTEKSESGSGSGSGNSDAAKSGEKETEASKEVREAQSELTSILAKAPGT